MPFHRDVFTAFAASGAVWTVGASWGLRAPAIAVVAAAYVLLGGVALALPRGRTWIAFATLWGCAVALMTMLTVPVAGVMAVVVGLVLGTLCFAAWVSTGFLLLHVSASRRCTTQG